MAIPKSQERVNVDRWINLASLDDSNDLSQVAYAIRSDVAGSIKVTHITGDTSTMSFAAGETRVCRVKRIWSTGTTTITASDLEYGVQDG